MTAIVASYSSSVRCGNPAMSPYLQGSCQDIIDTMAAGREQTTFGPPEDPLARYVTPYTLQSREYRKVYFIFPSPLFESLFW